MENKKSIEDVLGKIEKDKYELFIFDFDGTLVEPLGVNWVKLKKQLSALARIDFHEGLRVSNLLKKIRRKKGDKGLRQAYKVVENYESKAIKKARIRREIKTFIKKVSKKGKKIAIFSTNMRKTIEAILSKFNLKEFDLIVAKEDVKRYKPDPEGLNLILSKLKVPKLKALFLGDKEVDLESGRKAKVKTILIGDED